MFFLNLVKDFKRGLRNLKGFKSNEKLIVIESDDWGSIRMPNIQTYNKCLSDGYEVDKSPYTTYDGLESNEDIDDLCNILIRHKDVDGNHPVITTNFLVANPDFEKIKDSKYSNYFFESFVDTYKRYGEINMLDKILQATDSKLFLPQSHGREHLNVSRFTQDMLYKKENVIYSIDNQMLGIFPKIKTKNGNYYVCGFDYFDKEDEINKNFILNEGLDLFKQSFGFSSKTFIAQNYTWGDELNLTLKANGVKLLQGSFQQKIPIYNKYDEYILKTNYTGLIKDELIYSCRNSFFEPSVHQNIDNLNECLKQISIAFRMKSPAIISIHRINFTSRLDIRKRDQNLALFNKLLSEILMRWPDVKFISSEQLLDKIDKK